MTLRSWRFFCPSERASRGAAKPQGNWSWGNGKVRAEKSHRQGKLVRCLKNLSKVLLSLLTKTKKGYLCNKFKLPRKIT